MIAATVPCRRLCVATRFDTGRFSETRSRRTHNTAASVGGRAPRELKHITSGRKRNQRAATPVVRGMPQVAASEQGTVRRRIRAAQAPELWRGRRPTRPPRNSRARNRPGRDTHGGRSARGARGRKRRVTGRRRRSSVALERNAKSARGLAARLNTGAIPIEYYVARAKAEKHPAEGVKSTRNCCRGSGARAKSRRWRFRPSVARGDNRRVDRD